MTDERQQTRAFWDRVADDWQTQVGTHGDENRRLNSDPVLWRLAGNVRDLRVLDAGCGTGYLTALLAERGARVTGVDFSERMIAIAQASHPALEFRVDSCTTLETVEDHSQDLVIANYVLMDTPDLEATVGAFHRVLVPGGHALLVFSHPCFPAGTAVVSDDAGEVTYTWASPYFQRHRRVDPPWGHFSSEFIWFHRPLSDYWRAFVAAGFTVVDFEEPRLTEDRFHLAPDPLTLRKTQACPYSVAFRLRKDPLVRFRPATTSPTGAG